MKSKTANKIKNAFSDKTGDFYIQTLIGILIFMFVLMIGIAVTPIIINKIRIDYAADEIARYVALTGDSDISASSIQQIINTYNIDYSNVVIAADKPESGGETRIQLADGFSVTVNQPMQINFGGLSHSFTVNIISVARGRSEVYWKALDEP
ncbi:MAG: DUF4320 family protein [Oscillospiraceae bacterium]|nr:DUF4320 family protein [Oscillospiraceae bacterium]